MCFNWAWNLCTVQAFSWINQCCARFLTASALYWKWMFIGVDFKSWSNPSLSPRYFSRLSSVRSFPRLCESKRLQEHWSSDWTSEAVALACAVDYLSSDGVIFGRELFFHVMFYSSGWGLAVGGLQFCNVLGFYCVGRLKMLNSDSACGNRLWFMCFFFVVLPEEGGCRSVRRERERETDGRWKGSKR